MGTSRAHSGSVRGCRGPEDRLAVAFVKVNRAVDFAEFEVLRPAEITDIASGFDPALHHLGRWILVLGQRLVQHPPVHRLRWLPPQKPDRKNTRLNSSHR